MTDDSAASAPLDFDHADLPAEARLQCVACQREIAGTYYSVNARSVCPACHERFASAAGQGGSLARAALLGVGAAAVGGGLYYAVSALTGYEVGIVAIAVGVLVGKAVRKAAGLHDSVTYRVLAVALTYLAITGTYVPSVMSDGSEALSHAVVLSLVMPFFMATHASSFLGLVILGIGLYQAWKISAAPRLAIEGPFVHAHATPHV